MTVLETLQAALAKIADSKHWTTKHNARNAQGVQVPAFDPTGDFVRARFIESRNNTSDQESLSPEKVKAIHQSTEAIFKNRFTYRSGQAVAAIGKLVQHINDLFIALAECCPDVPPLPPDAARTMSPEEQEAQRRSFAYGNTKIDNDNITRDGIDRAAESLRKGPDAAGDEQADEQRLEAIERDLMDKGQAAAGRHVRWLIDHMREQIQYAANWKAAAQSKPGKSYCTHCGKLFPQSPTMVAEFTAHIAECNAHPLHPIAKERAALAARCEAMEKALAFYADKQNYVTGKLDNDGSAYNMILQDCGAKARKAAAPTAAEKGKGDAK